MRLPVLFGFALGGLAADPGGWSAVEAVLRDATAARKVPAAVAVAGSAAGRQWSGAFGSYTDDGRPPFGNATLSTVFDMASLTKVTTTTSAVALLYQAGLLRLDERVASDRLLGQYGFGQNGKSAITVTDCLVHAAGFPPDPSPCYWDPKFGCAGAPLPDTPPDFNCSERIFEGFNAQTLVRPPNTEFQYSDLSMITLMYVVGRVVGVEGLVPESALLPECRGGGSGLRLQCLYEAFARTHVFEPLGMDRTGFRPPAAARPQCAPTAPPHLEAAGLRTLQGEVNDGNSYLLGGIAGHAGLFTDAGDLEKLVRALLAPSAGVFLNETTVALFTTVHNRTQSSRALGWDTDSDLCGAGFPAETFTHTGYTGTQICADRSGGRYTVLLTNRVYPIDDDASEKRISALRHSFNTAAYAALTR